MSKQENKSNNSLKQAGASYIISFYQEVQLLNHNFAIYLNAYLEIQKKTTGDPGKVAQLSDNEVINLNNTIQIIRVSVIKAYLGYKTIISNLKIEERPVIEQKYNKFTTVYNFEWIEMQEYVLELNNLLVSQVIKELIDNSQNLLENIYSENE